MKHLNLVLVLVIRLPMTRSGDLTALLAGVLTQVV